MTDFEIFWPYLIALMMSLGALCIFVWGVLSGAFSGADEAALRFFRTEMDDDRASHAETTGD
jgi:cbb3-type cytochrome oxidase maturation protein